MRVEDSESKFERWDRMDSGHESSDQNIDDLIKIMFSKFVNLENLTKIAESYVNKIEKDLIKVVDNRPDKANDRQSYYLFRAREEQIHYECAFIKSTQEFLHGHLLSAWLLYGRAIHHLHRRTGFEEKAFRVWLQRLKAKENPPKPDIDFINHGIIQYKC